MLGDKRILVTGAAGGIGREIAIEAARQGARHVGIADVNAEALAETKGLVEAAGATVHTSTANLRDAAAIESMVEELADFAGGIDVVVNNAGVLEHHFTTADQVTVDGLPIDVWDAVMDINLKAPWLVVKYATPHLRRSDRGPAVVNAASVSGMTGYPAPAYAASKGGIIQLTRAMAIQLAPDVRCNSFSPGSVKTPMSDARLAAAADPVAQERAMSGSHLIPRRGLPIELAYAACWLASDQASFVTGTNLPVDGGTMAWRGVRDE